MTLRKYIKKANDRELAEMLIFIKSVEDYDYDCDDNLYQCGSMEYYVTTDGQMFGGCGCLFDSDAEDAINHQIKLLQSEYKPSKKS